MNKQTASKVAAVKPDEKKEIAELVSDSDQIQSDVREIENTAKELAFDYVERQRPVTQWDAGLANEYYQQYMSAVIKLLSERKSAKIAADGNDRLDRMATRIATEVFPEGEGPRIAGEFPYGRAGGQVKRTVQYVLKRYGWSNVNIFDSRDGAGFNIYGTRNTEQLPDIDMTGGRTNDDLRKDFEKEAGAIKRELESKLQPKPEDVVVKIDVQRTHNEGNKGNLYVWLKYTEGGYVTPLEIL